MLFSRVWPALGDLWPIVGCCWPSFGQGWSLRISVADSSQSWHELGKCCCQSRANVGHHQPKVDAICFGRSWGACGVGALAPIEQWFWSASDPSVEDHPPSSLIPPMSVRLRLTCSMSATPSGRSGVVRWPGCPLAMSVPDHPAIPTYPQKPFPKGFPNTRRFRTPHTRPPKSLREIDSLKQTILLYLFNDT